MALKKPVVIETTLADCFSNFQVADTLDVDGSLTVNESGGDKDTRIEGDTATNLVFVDASLDAFQIGTTVAGALIDARSTAVVFNEPGNDVDFRVESDTSTQALVVDAGLDAVQIGTTVAGSIADFRSTVVVLNETGADQDLRVEGDNATNLLVADAGLDAIQIGTTVAGAIADFRSTIIVLNETGADQDLRVEGDTATSLFVVDAGLDAVQIGTTVAGALADFRAATVTINDAANDVDFRVEGDTLEYMIFAEGNAASENIAVLTTAAPNWQSMDRGIFIGSVTTAPTGNPSSGTFLWSEGDALNIRNSAGTIRNLFTDNSGGGLTLTSVKTAAYTAVANDEVLCDSNGASGDFAISLPASPSSGDRVKVDLVTDHATRTVTIDRNGSNVNGGTDTARLRLVLEGDCVDFRYVGGDCGWYASRYFRSHYAHLRRAASQTINNATDTHLDFDTSDVDIGGIGDITNNRFNIRRTGIYNLSVYWGKLVAFDNNEQIVSWIRHVPGGGSSSSANRRFVAIDFATAATQTAQSKGGFMLQCEAGDTLEMWIEQTSGASMTTDATNIWFQPQMMVGEMI